MSTKPTHLKKLARAEAREMLSQSTSFHTLGQSEQLALYKDMVNAAYDRLARQAGGNGASSGGAPGAVAFNDQETVPGAGQQIDDDRHLNQRIDQAGELMGDFVQQVNFPQFVEDLVTGVFDANLKVTLEQMRTYQELLKTASQSVSKFVNDVDDAAAFGHLAENNNDEFSISLPPEGGGTGGGQSGPIVLTDKDGNPVDTEDTKIKAKIMDAKIQMAREQRAMLRETILMGISRLVVEKGVIEAGVVFDLKASENVAKSDRAANKQTTTEVERDHPGFLRRVLGGRNSAEKTRRASISVASAKSVANTELAAKLTGNVKIEFKSDYFALDNFAEMYGPSNDENAGSPGSGGSAQSGGG